jgi:hypothetical protein
MLKSYNSYDDLDANGRPAVAGFTLAARSCSLVNTDPHVLQRHPVMGMRAAFASLIRDGLNDNPSSPPQSRHIRLAKGPLFYPARLATAGGTSPTLGGMPRVGV